KVIAINKGERREMFEKGQRVLVKDYRKQNSPIRTKATITEILGNKNYLCLFGNGTIWKSHLNQIKKLDYPLEPEEIIANELHILKTKKMKTPATSKNNVFVNGSPNYPTCSSETSAICFSPLPRRAVDLDNNYPQNVEHTRVTKSDRTVCKPLALRDYEC
ncbi:hypothetical protein ILUMI_14038, partial [Ignelater luminosus]